MIELERLWLAHAAQPALPAADHHHRPDQRRPGRARRCRASACSSSTSSTCRSRWIRDGRERSEQRPTWSRPRSWLDLARSCAGDPWLARPPARPDLVPALHPALPRPRASAGRADRAARRRASWAGHCLRLPGRLRCPAPAEPGRHPADHLRARRPAVRAQHRRARRRAKSTSHAIKVLALAIHDWTRIAERKRSLDRSPGRLTYEGVIMITEIPIANSRSASARCRPSWPAAGWTRC